MQNIVLIGMPGCGKSTIGVILAKTLGMEFLDTDLVIQKRESALLQQILDSRGFEAFLDAEESAVLSLESLQNTVIATGGSVVYRSAAMEYLRESGKVVYLQLPYSEMMGRLKNIKTRGIALPQGKTMKQLYEERIPLYEKYAQLIVDCAGKTPEEVVTDLVSRLDDSM